MILKDSLYTIVSQQQDDSSVLFCVRIHPEWPIYEAHFPRHPITPGVCIIQMVQELLQELQSSDPRLRSVENRLRLIRAKHVKYVSIISPEEVTEIFVTFLKIDPQPDGCVKVQAEVSSGEKLYTKLSAIFC
ncbi:MAG: hydroxymyristoyl-ACP dehydratase [Prevotellaceae bacterium]|nr:hydroxymyristoyl-ACP dehydratase [Prevotellaceae bacterium]